METLKIQNSSQIRAVAYDAVAAELYVEYQPKKDGTRAAYVYRSVPPTVFMELTEAIGEGASAGKWIAANVKPRFQSFSPLDAEMTVAVFGEEPKAEAPAEVPGV